MARAGQPVELAPRDVVIHEFSLLEWDVTDPARPVAITEVTCSAGTYIRALARDLGARLESGAYLAALVRLASGAFRLEDAVSFEDLRDGAAGGPDGFAALLRPIDAGLEHLPHARITAEELRRLGEGLPTGPKSPLEVPDAETVLVTGPDGRVVAVCRAVGGILHPHKVLAERPSLAGKPVGGRTGSVESPA
jgi:tRNA pseudouridine55 synthase